MLPLPETTPWLPFRRAHPDARVRLFCFPYAGGGASLYRDWPFLLGSDVEVCAVQLPGREQRIREAGFARMAPLIEALDTALSPYLDQPFALFGHSMGAIIAYELGVRLQARGLVPAHTFVSARRAPHIDREHKAWHQLPDAQFMDKLRGLNGTPEEVLNDPELMKLVLPLLRLDFELNETYRPGRHDPLQCPVTAFGGVADHEVKLEDIEAWRELSGRSFQYRLLPGGHFFIHDTREALLSQIVGCLGMR